ncbi:methyl-accepting chemotaxis protein [Kineosporia sp. J2-2]|uniref:Methyl-accepting chemotaxis protein n=1 Tax=Kineosporia corallincola TaxID=2835133 RepID=A0ABS5TEV3_9ACTN|nr:methyl-accepting chemotaxis protein [Kineosporia corallincola]MBT0769606.1 methyl-accepting chemotaxis protein [Kineosporia corallincola]
MSAAVTLPGQGNKKAGASPAAFFKNLSLLKKIFSLIAVASLLAVGIGVIGMRAVNAVQSTSDHIVSVTAKRDTTALEARLAFASLRRNIMVAALTTGETSKTAQEDVATSFDEMSAKLDALKASGLDSADTALLEQDVTDLATVKGLYTDNILPVISQNDLTGVQYRALGTYIAGDFATAATKVSDGLNKLGSNAADDMSTEAADAKSSAESQIVQSWIITAVGLLIMVGFGFWIARLIVAAVGRVRDGLVALADGDLTQSVPVTSNDEVGEMSAALNRASTSLRSAMEDIRTNSVTLSGSAEELSAVSAQVASNSEETSAQAMSLSATSSQVSGNVQTVAAGTEEMSASIREIANSSAEAARVSAGAATEAATATETVGKLGASSEEIGNVVKTITTIAEQTNLLALNATIEAARAGDAGKGFAVVAEEVKQLAQETARATEDISHRVETIQADTRAAVEAIDRITRTIEDVNSYQTTIASAVEEQTAVTSEIARSIDETARAASRISSDVDAVSNAAQSSSTGISEAQRAAGDLAQVAGGLNELVGRFKI